MAKRSQTGHIRRDKANKDWIGIDPVYYRDLLSKMNKLPKEVQKDIRESSFGLSRDLAKAIERSGQMNALVGTAPPQAALVAQTVVPKKDRIIRVEIGGTKRVGRKFHPLKTRRKLKNGKYSGPWRKAMAGALLYGSEFGSSGEAKDWRGRAMGRRFVLRHRPYNLGSTDNGYWIHPAWRDFIPKAFKEWEDLVNSAIEQAGFKRG